MPLTAIFSRYYIALQPVLVSVMLLDILIIIEVISKISYAEAAKRKIRIEVLTLLIIMFACGMPDKIAHLRSRIYEMFNVYKDPLDFAIPYIKTNYKNPENLIIATNYEEGAYMYYLGSKVTMGYVGNNLEEDLKIRPDIIIFRKRPKPGYVNARLFNSFFQKAKYIKISFPVFDYWVNNIPELNDRVFPTHLYKTPMAINESECLDIYIREGVYH